MIETTNITSDKIDTSYSNTTDRVLTHDINAVITIPDKANPTKPDPESAKFLIFSVDAVKEFLFANYFWLNDTNIDSVETDSNVLEKELTLSFDKRVLAYIKYINPEKLNQYFIDFIQNDKA
jgi:hypothetical protein